eukprot:1318604-Amorphochlora_amoeboformis.AAC.1
MPKRPVHVDIDAGAYFSRFPAKIPKILISSLYAPRSPVVPVPNTAKEDLPSVTLPGKKGGKGFARSESGTSSRDISSKWIRRMRGGEGKGREKERAEKARGRHANGLSTCIIVTKPLVTLFTLVSCHQK